jgi:hypothetical protein
MVPLFIRQAQRFLEACLQVQARSVATVLTVSAEIIVAHARITVV